MDLQLTGNVAIVQGASKGIGRGIARCLAREGCDLVLTARTEETLAQTAAEIAAETGRNVKHFALDSSNVEAQTSLVDFAREQFGRLDILVANSGGPAPGGLKDLSPEQWRAAADLLIVGPTLLLKTALPLLKQSPAPRFFVVTSSSTVTPVSGLALSNTFRPAIVGLIKQLTEELAAENVCCHSVAPGRVDTDRLANIFAMQGKKQDKSPEEMRDAALKMIPAGRLGTPEDLGNLVAYLSSPLAEYLRGGNWLVDGGLIRVI